MFDNAGMWRHAKRRGGREKGRNGAYAVKRQKVIVNEMGHMMA